MGDDLPTHLLYQPEDGGEPNLLPVRWIAYDQATGRYLVEAALPDGGVQRDWTYLIESVPQEEAS